MHGDLGPRGEERLEVGPAHLDRRRPGADALVVDVRVEGVLCALQRARRSVRYRDEEVEAKVTEISGRKPERSQTVGGRRFWYFPVADGVIQLVWWKSDLGMYHYEINDY